MVLLSKALRHERKKEEQTSLLRLFLVVELVHVLWGGGCFQVLSSHVNKYILARELSKAILTCPLSVLTSSLVYWLLSCRTVAALPTLPVIGAKGRRGQCAELTLSWISLHLLH